MSETFDLFGDPIPVNWGRRGRPEHIPTNEYRNKIKLLLAFGWNNERIANAIGVTPPTLRKHYFPELRARGEMRDKLDASRAMRLWAEVEKGSVSAIREFGKLLERNDLMTFGQTTKPVSASPARTPKLGKKEAALAAAQAPDTGSTLGQLIASRQAQAH